MARFELSSAKAMGLIVILLTIISWTNKIRNADFDDFKTKLTEQTAAVKSFSLKGKNVEKHATQFAKSLSLKKVAAKRWPTIPNILHYVHFVKDENSSLEFDFRHWLSVYSAGLYMKPDIIYIHTDASKYAIEEAHKPNPESKWTSRLLKLANVKMMPAKQTIHAGNGVKIDRIEHRSDFTRVEAVIEYGGIYFDFDVYALRDMTPLREMGFANVVGLEVEARTNNGLTMSVKGSELMRLWLKQMHSVYDGGWTTHSCILLTKICRRLSLIPYEVQILEQAAWHPYPAFDPEIGHQLFDPHEEMKVVAPTDNELEIAEGVLSTKDGEDLYRTEGIGLTDWQADFSSTYAIHAFKHPNVMWASYFSVKYALKRQANFSRAIYPAVKHALDAGLIMEDD